MKHLHFETIDSTQIFLKEKIDQLYLTDHEILVSCNNQTSGIGRNGNHWDHQRNSIAISFSLTPNEKLSLTTIEIGILIIQFFKERFKKDIFLKWPNDLMDHNGKKLGGIITNFHSSSILITGVGINLQHANSSETYRHGITSLSLEIDDLKNLSSEIYQFILSHRLNKDEVIHQFEKYCLHINKNIEVIEEQQTKSALTIGINDQGALIVKMLEGNMTEITSGSINLMN